MTPFHIRVVVRFAEETVYVKFHQDMLSTWFKPGIQIIILRPCWDIRRAAKLRALLSRVVDEVGGGGIFWFGRVKEHE